MYKKIRFYIRFISALTTRYYPYLIAGLVLAVITFFSFPYLISRLPTLRLTQKIAIIGRYTLTDLPSTITDKITIGLTSLDQSGQPGAGAAKSWEISPDGKTLNFTINTDLVWHNQTPLVSSDIKYQFKDAIIEYPDSSHLVFHLKDPYSPLPTLLSKPIIRYQTSKLFKSTKVLGLGSYKISSFKSNGGVLESLLLSPVNSGSKQPYLSYRFYSSSQQARTAFKLGLVDQIEDLPDLAELKDWPNTTVNKTRSTERYVGLFFNTQGPNFSGASGKNFRLAISYAVNKTRWQYRAISPISPDSWAFNPDTKRYDQDVKRAQELMKKVEKVPEKLVINTVPAYLSIAEEVKKDLADIKLNSEILVSQEIPSEFDILLIAQATPTDPDQYNLWHSTQTTTNLTKLNNPRIDKLLEDGRKTYNLTERKRIYYDFQKYLTEEAPTVFLFYPELYTLYRK